MPKKDMTIYITCDDEGPTLEPEANADCMNGPSETHEGKACGWTKFKVSWEAAAGVDWTVEFKDRTPFEDGRTLFSNRPTGGGKGEPPAVHKGGKIKEGTEGEYEYAVQCTGKSMKSKKSVPVPKIVIMDGS